MYLQFLLHIKNIIYQHNIFGNFVFITFKKTYLTSTSLVILHNGSTYYQKNNDNLTNNSYEVTQHMM